MGRGLVWVMAMVLGFALPVMPAVAAPSHDACTCMMAGDDCAPATMTMAACQQCCPATLPSMAVVEPVAEMEPTALVAVLRMLRSHPASLDPPPPRRG